MNSYTINQIDDQGNAVVTVNIGDAVYVQQLCGLPVNDATALQDRLSQYVTDYAAGLATSNPTPPAAAPLIDEPQPVS